MNNGIDGNPQALPVNTQFSAYPWAVWAARVRIDPTPEFNAMAGVYQVSDRIFNRNYHGLDWSMRSNDSILLIGQIGWTPEFFKRAVRAENQASSDGKTTAGAKSIAAVKSAKQLSPVPSSRDCQATTGLALTGPLGISRSSAARGVLSSRCKALL